MNISKKNKLKEATIGYVLIGPSIILMILLLFIPIVYSFYLSFMDTSLSKPLAEFIGFKGYVELFQNKYTLVVLRSSFLWTVLVVFFQFSLGLFSAVLLNRTFRLRWLIRSVVILPWVLPGVIAAMVWKLIYDAQLGFLSNLLLKLHIIKNLSIDWLGTPNLSLFAVIFTGIWKGFGFSMLMSLAALQTVPKELYEAAKIDGANDFQVFFKVTIPSISNVIRITLLLISVWTFNYFEIIYVMTGGGPIKSTHIAPTYIYELAFRNFNFGDASRFAIISFIIVSIISIVYIREFLKKEDRYLR